METLATNELDVLRALSALRGGLRTEPSPYQEMLDEIRRRQIELTERYAAAADQPERVAISHQRALLADLAVWACERRNEAHG